MTGLIFNARGKTLVEEIIAITGAVSSVVSGVGCAMGRKRAHRLCGLERTSVIASNLMC